MKETPLFSIIVVSYNASVLIKGTLESILSQTFTNYEIVVKDACSTDDTIEYIPKHEKIRLFRLKDSGIYDGMNYAISKSEGLYLLFLNCGDIFASNTVLEKIAEHIEQNAYKDRIVYGDCLMNGVLKKQPSTITPFFLYRTPLCHQSMFFSKRVFIENGMYDTSYKILADYECTVKAFMNGDCFSYMSIPVCIYLGGGVSESANGIRTKKQEYHRIHKKYFSLSERTRYGVLLFISCRWLRNWIASNKSPRILRELYWKLVNGINR